MSEIFPDKNGPDVYRVEAVDDDGGCEVAIFSGPNALGRAHAFAQAYYKRGATQQEDPAL